ncbi:hypothetical protein JY477_00725 [Serratia marcescens]|nr:hypothetical protein [Serratia marcescens]
MKKIAVLVTAVGLLIGCSTNAVPPNQAIDASPNRIFGHQGKTDEMAQLLVVRDSGMVGGGCYTAVFIDGGRVALLNAKEKATFYISPGEHIIGASFEGAGLCSMGKERQERDFTFDKGKVRVLRIYIDADANIDIKPTTLQ